MQLDPAPPGIPAHLFDQSSGNLQVVSFSAGAWAILEQSAVHAAGSGEGQIQPVHLLLALVHEPEGPLPAFLAESGRDGPSASAIEGAIRDAIGGHRKESAPPALDKRGVSAQTAIILQAALDVARAGGPSGVESPHLWSAFLEHIPPRLRSTLTLPPLEFPLDEFSIYAYQLGRALERGPRVPSFAWLPGLLPSMDLTRASEGGHITAAVELRRAGASGSVQDGPDIYDQISRVLYRRKNNHVLITGLKGVGKTTVVRELARRAAAGDVPFLGGKRFLWVDGQDVTPEESRACLEAIFSHLPGTGDVVLCLDGLGSLLKRPQGGSNRNFLRALLNGARIRLVGVMSRLEFGDLLAGDTSMLELFTRAEVEEPGDEPAAAMIRQAAGELSREYDVVVEDQAIQRALALSSTYMLSERLPAKAVKILRHACDDLDYERTQFGRGRGSVAAPDVVRVVSVMTGLPEETLTGEAGLVDFAATLSAAVIGQGEAVRAVGDELMLIKAGLTDPGKPAAVLLFAGMTGVGKTELAKRLAELYSTSKILQTYTMGNFVEPHSVSAIIGVPPGYVGHELGGRLINELNADPYAVFLLDEAEKCHPNVWKPFLNLFDEGWIVDQRGIKAHADRAIFILTTNAGDEAIAQMSRSGKSPEEVAEHVRATLPRVRQERSGQPVFTPQFLARMKRIIVFNPLDEGAMVGIARGLVKRVRGQWLQKRERAVLVPEGLIEAIGRYGHHLNDKSGGKEGGRILRKLISDQIEGKIQQQAALRHEEYKSCRSIALEFEPSAPDPEMRPPLVTVNFLP